MKKVIIVLLILTIVLAFASCGKEEELAGGFVDVEDGTITEELLDMYNRAQASWNGISMEPVKLLQTQVVAGTNYKFLAKQELKRFSETGEIEPEITYYEVIVYEDLDGNVTIISDEKYEGEIE